MGFFEDLGEKLGDNAPAIIGGAAGFALGGPQGAVMGAGLGAGLMGANSQKNAAKDAAALSAQVSREQLALQQRMYEESIKRQQPFLDIGTNALNRLNALNQPGADLNKFLTLDPGYSFRLGEGTKALERSAAARGGLLSGATGKALTRYGQDYGSQEFGNAYNRLAGLANLGPQAAGVMSNLGQNTANSMNNLAMANLTNQGNSMMAMANARTSQYNTMAGLLGRAIGTNWNSDSTPTRQDTSWYGSGMRD